jgi:hypothetical protein
MQRLYRSSRENDRRRDAAIEAANPGRGGGESIAARLGCHPKTIRHGVAELGAPDQLDSERVRKGGAASG